MGAGFCTLYHEIHYIEVRYIKVWVYLWFFLIFPGEIEEVGAQRYQKISPSIHETHFEEDIDLPTTVLHHPGIYIVQLSIFKNQSCLLKNFSNY